MTHVRKFRAGKPRVVLLSPSLSAVSGVSTHAKMLLGSKLAADFDLHHFQVGSEGRREGPLGRAWRFLSSPLALGVTLVRRRADIVHLNTSLNQKAFWRDLVYLSVARLLGCKVVNQVHGGALPQTFFAGRQFFTWILRRVLVGSGAVVVLSTEELRAYKSFDSRINVHLVPNAVEPGGLMDISRGYNFNLPLRLVYVGRLVASKGVFEIIEALRLLRVRGRKFACSIAGGGPDEVRMREAAVRAGLEDRVTFLGPIFGEAKNRLWLESDVFVFPTWHREGLPYSILEAMAAGCVPVTCSVAGIADVVQDEVHGLFVPSKDPEALAHALTRLDEDRDALSRMAQAGRGRVSEQYTTERLAQDFRELYRKSLRMWN